MLDDRSATLALKRDFTFPRILTMRLIGRIAQQQSRQSPSLRLFILTRHCNAHFFVPYEVFCCAWCLTHVALPLHSIVIKSLVSLNYHLSAIFFQPCTVITSNNPLVIQLQLGTVIS